MKDNASREPVLSLTGISESILDDIKAAWGWTGINPVQIIADNEFGNLLLFDHTGRIWRLCPENTSCEVVAESQDEYSSLIKTEEFQIDWFMTCLVHDAEKHLGKLQPGQKYHMVIPGIFGGEYNVSNIKTAPLQEIVRISGDLGEQIANSPDGTQIILRITQ